MTYCHVLIHTARAIPILLVHRSLWRSIRTHLVGLTIDICELAGRVGAVLLFPVAVPIVAILIVASLRREGWEQECLRVPSTQRGREMRNAPSEPSQPDAIVLVMPGENGRLSGPCSVNRCRSKPG